MEKIRILLADDDKTTTMLLQKGLQSDVFESRVVHDGGEVFSIYQEWKPEIILLDIMMPSMTGYTVLKKIRLELEDSMTTVIMATSLSGKSDVVSCVELGIQGYIIKPFKADEIAGTVLKYFQKINPAKAFKARACLDNLRPQGDDVPGPLTPADHGGTPT